MNAIQLSPQGTDGMDGNDFLLGWFLIRRRPKYGVMSDLVPERILTASHCLSDVRPLCDDWLEDDRLAFLQQHQCNVEGNVIFLDSHKSALEMKRRWLEDDYEIFALAMRSETAKRLDIRREELQTATNLGTPSFCYSPLERQAFTGRERLIGYDVLGYDGGWHTYLCSGLEKELLELFGTRVNEEGLIPDGNVAERFAAYIEKNQVGEPGLYLAYAFYRLTECSGPDQERC